MDPSVATYSGCKCHKFVRVCFRWVMSAPLFLPVSVINLEEKWSFASVLLVGEIIKLAVSTVMTLADKTPSPAGTGLSKLCWLVRASPPMVLPAVIFWIMNLLSYVSMETLDASTFTLFAQVFDMVDPITRAVVDEKDNIYSGWECDGILGYKVVRPVLCKVVALCAG